jgi:energy-coupling factor transporter ATP-binding protein EcfA2
MFKLIGIRVFEGCKEYIYKCLHVGMMYYFCNDYVIGEGRRCVRRVSKNLKPIRSDFFGTCPEVNVSAVVGMNGDGKSTIVELIMRLVNNCAIAYELAAKAESLRRVEGVKAELFYMIDHVVYRMAEENGQNEPRVWKIADLSDQSRDEWQLGPAEPVDIGVEMDKFFFTFVSNYSHYAYNIYDFHHEWEIRGDEEDDNEKCWLHYIFHKNDGYLAPITLHPYRDKGNIDINKEKSLSKQRLLSLFLNADNPNQNAQSFRRVNGKDAETLVLKEQKESKLHTKVIADYFRNSRQKVVFNTVLNQISNVDRDGEFDDKEYERLIDTVLPYFWEESLDEVINQDEGFKSFVEQMIVWLERNQNKVFSSSSDIRQVLRRLNELKAKFPHLNLNVPHGRYGTMYGFLVKLNGAQLGRLDTVYRIIKFHHVDPAIVYKNFNDLTLEERCWHYIVYKTWSILETYPQYTKRLEADKPQKGSVREYGHSLEECMQMIMSDRDSHVTRKLRQVFNFFDEGLEHGGLYERLGNWREADNSLLVDLDTLKDHYYGGIIKPDHLPPAIYEWDLEFRKVGDLYNSIEFDSFSSGEKQMLNSIGAIIYHLQNLETSSTVIYSNVNIILEEIELYYHPECQRGFINRLLELIAGLNLENIQNINVIFVTHSPFILSDIPKNHVLFLNDGIAQNTMQENTFGANIHSLLKNGFFLPNLPMGEFAYRKINEFFRKLNTGDIDRETELEDVYQQILLVGEPFLRNQLLGLYHALKGN